MKTKLDKEEQDILTSIENGEWESIYNVDFAIKDYAETAKQSLRKVQRINIRLTTRDLDLLRKKALIEGIPYQTLISSILHKYVNGY